MNDDKACAADELLPCPFCGGKAAMCVLEDSPGDIISAWVNCSCGMETHERRTEAEAAEKWNTRSPPTEPPASFRRIYEEMQRGKVTAGDGAKS